MGRFEIQDGKRWAELARRARFKAGQFSAALGISRRQLHRETKASFGCSAHIWLNGLRLKAAAELLKKYQSVKMVCFDLEFRQQSHFSREFKRFYGLSPSAFLRKHDNRNEERNEAQG